MKSTELYNEIKFKNDYWVVQYEIINDLSQVNQGKPRFEGFKE